MQAARLTTDESFSPKSKLRPLSWFLDASTEIVALLSSLPLGCDRELSVALFLP